MKWTKEDLKAHKGFAVVSGLGGEKALSMAIDWSKGENIPSYMSEDPEIDKMLSLAKYIADNREFYKQIVI